MKKLFELFEEFGLPYYRQGSLSDADYKPDFFTFWNIDSPNDSFYDDHETRFIEIVQVGFYTNDRDKVYSVMDEFCEKAKEKGFVRRGRPTDAPADKANYYGRVCMFHIINKL